MNDDFPRFYHQPLRSYIPDQGYASIVRAGLPRRWRLQVGPMWNQVISPIPRRRTQGWKIHLSARLEDAVHALQIVTAIVPSYQTEFKFAADKNRHIHLLSKNVARQSGGKFITIYPPSDEVFADLLEVLYASCGELRGPYILSDRQYKDSAVLFYRYGGFQAFTEINVFQERKSLILDDTYCFVEDQRRPGFVLPPFATIPVAIAMQETPAKPNPGLLKPKQKTTETDATSADADLMGSEADQQQTEVDQETPAKEAADPIVLNQRYEMLGVLKQSNIGGVYAARDRESGDPLVLREARPHTDPDVHGQDAVVRRRREYEIHRELEDLDIAACAIDFFESWQHSFLVLSHVPGSNLRQQIVTKCPVLHAQSSASELSEWFGIAHQVAIDLIGKVKTMHDRGIVYGDISTNNLIRDEETGQLFLIDFETAFRPGIDKGHNAFTPGYAFMDRAARLEAEPADDIIGVGATLLALVCPSACNLALVDGLADLVFASLEEDYGLDPAYGAAAKRLLSGEMDSMGEAHELLCGSDPRRAHAMGLAPRQSERGKLHRLFDDLCLFLSDHGDFSRPEPLYAMDPEHDENWLALDHGLAGIALAQCRLGLPKGRENAQVVSRQLERGAETPGLLNGLAGGAWTLMEAGDDSGAEALLAACDNHVLLYSDYSLGHGLAGIGLASLRLWQRTSCKTAIERVRDICALLSESAQWVNGTAAWPGLTHVNDEPLRIGLHTGATGIALFLAYAHCVIGDRSLLDLAMAGLSHDLSFARQAGASTGFPKQAAGEGSGILYPYLEVGTAGVVSVALRLYRLTGDSALEQFIHDMLPSVAQRYTVSAGLGKGLAGLAHCLLDAAALLSRPDIEALAWRTAGGLLHFRVPMESGAATPSLYGNTVSATYIDGCAGVALLLDRLLHGRPAFHFSLDELLPASAPSSN
jgi:hypothetical protein